MFYSEFISLTPKKISFFSKLIRAFEISGMSRAAEEFYRLGYYKEHQLAIKNLKKLREE